MGDRKRILAIDDEEDLRIILKEELTDEGYEVFTLGDPAKAMDKIEETNPDLILLDIKMPGMSGMDLLNLIRGKYYDLPVILLTAYSSFKKDIAAAACDQYVVKSGDFTELKKRVRKTLSVTA
ncbi:MAG: response regulator [Nitrospiraceae bacterium]|nr:response regulator [Nitrospiraceae bacterium]